jgi:hypothetical protein
VGKNKISMKAIGIKLNTYVRSVSVVNNNVESIILNIILWSFAVLAILYILFLGNMVKNIVERRSLETRALALSSEVRNLELTYLSLSNKIDLPLSYSLGFKEAQTTFATQKSLGYGNVSEPAQNVKIVQNDL